MKAFLLTAADDGINLLFNEFKFNTWEDISPAIGCRTFDVVRLYENGDCAYIDDEGLYQANWFWIHKNYPNPIANIINKIQKNGRGIYGLLFQQ